MTDNEVREWLHSMDIYDYDICDGVVHVVGNVDLSYRGLTRIPVQFGYVSGDFYCGYNLLESLAGCPNEVGIEFYCVHNRLESLKGGPKEVGEDFDCRYNKLESLEGCPSEVGGSFYCMDNMFDLKPDHNHMKIGGAFEWE
jgi:hypothetical protein